MKTLLALFVLAAGFAQAESPTHPRDRWLSADQVLADLTLAQQAYERIHPGYSRYVSKQHLEQQWQAIGQRASAQGGMRLADFYLQISELLAIIRCDHSKAELPAELAKARLKEAVYLPFQWRYIEGSMWVEEVAKDSPLKRGDRIISIDGTAVNQRIQAVRRYVPVDGWNDHTKINLVASSAEHQGGALDHFGALLWPPRETVNISYSRSGQAAKTVSLKRISYPGWQALKPATVRNFKDAVEFTWLDQQTAYLSIDTFVNYRQPVNPDDLFKPVFQALSNQPAARLILDLRNNGGGSNEPAQRLLAHLMNQRFRIARAVTVNTLDFGDLKPHLTTWDSQALEPNPAAFESCAEGPLCFRQGVLPDTAWHQPVSLPYSGPLLVLTSRNNSSGSTNIMTVLKKRPHTTFIGEATGGSLEGPTAGIMFFLKLSNSQITARIPVFRYHNDTAQFIPGKGLEPDIYVTDSVEDFLQGKDAILNQALASMATETPPL